MRAFCRIAFALALAAPAAGLPAPDDRIDFERDVRPIFEQRCLSCHDRQKRKGGLLLTDRKSALQKAESGLVAFIAGDPDASELLRRVASSDPEQRMPPKGASLTGDQIQTLRRWIREGAVWPSADAAAPHWAYVKPVRPALPAVRDAAWPVNEIDRFVHARLEKEGLRPSPAAAPARLIRRLHLDLVGLPPDVRDVDAFAADPSPAAYERVVDRLLASPRFGEHWARPWLDLARYADSNGYQSDQLRESWAFRDWVIRALNADLPFDRFTIEQLAGDLLPGATAEQRIATGFHRATPCNVEAGVDPEENRVNQIFDRVNTTATVWLGTTMECAQCHSHKYDPFTQLDYYRLFAYFNATPLEVKQTAGVTFDFVGPTMTLPTPPDRKARFDELGRKLEALERDRDAAARASAEQRRSWEARLRTLLRGEPPRWHVLTPQSFAATGGEEAQIRDDGSIFVGGTVPETSTYTVTARTDLRGVTAFRLEVLTDPSIPGGGPGRGDDLRPNFVLNELSVKAGDARVELHAARADFSQKEWGVQGAIDGDLKTGWAIAPQFNKPHWAEFRTREPLDGGTLLFTLDQNYGSGRTIGRLRLSAWVADPEVLDLTEELRKILAKPAASAEETKKLDAFYRSHAPELRKLEDEIAAVKRQRDAIRPPTTLVMVEMDASRPTYLLRRGDFLTRGEPVGPGVPEALHPLPPDAPANRLGLARWLVSRDNPLSARVAVNRWWAQIFGRGLVRSPEDFGTQGERPSHPELLDWMAVEFMDGANWSMKRLLKLVVMSATYRQSSRVPAPLLDRDPENLLLARGPRFRLAAEAIRDNALAASGLLTDKLGGPPVMPYQPPGLWNHTGRNQPAWTESPGEDRFRRGIYVIWRRAAPYPSFTAFDAPDRSSCVAQRARTNTPLQALALLNDPAYTETALALAARMMEAASDEARASEGFRRCVARTPAPRELDLVLETYRTALERYRARPADATRRTDAAARLGLPAGLDRVRLAAWADVANLLLNLDETVTKG